MANAKPQPGSSTESERKSFCWVTFLDAYGFSNEVRLRKDKSITEMLRQLGVQLRQQRPRLDAAFQFSDSIFLIKQVMPDPSVSLLSIFEAVASLQKCAIEHRFAFRGAVCVGWITITDFGCYGPPVETAVRLETHLASPTVVLPKKDIIAAQDHICQASEFGDIFDYHLETRIVKTKSGVVEGHVLKPPLRLFADLAHDEIRKTQIYGPDHIPAAWQLALEHLGIVRDRER